MAKLGEVRFKSSSGEKQIPVLEPGDVNYPAFRISMPGNKVGVIPLMDVSAATDPALRIQTADGKKTVGALITLEDFEHGYPNPSNGSGSWGPNSSNASLTSNPSLEGNNTLALKRWTSLTRSDIKTPRDGAEYLFRVQPGSGVPTPLVCCQNLDAPFRNCYALHLNTQYNTWFGIKKYVNGNQNILNVTYDFAGGQEVQKGTTYTIGVTLQSSSIRARLYKLDGTVLADISDNDTSYSNGTLGLYAGGDPGTDYFDLIQKRIF